MLPGQLALQIPAPGAPMPPADAIVRRADPPLAAGDRMRSGVALRWTLERWWRDRQPHGGPHVLFIGHNPNSADSAFDDMSSTRWTGFAWRWGYAGYIAVNLYPFRSAEPGKCPELGATIAGGAHLAGNIEVIAAEAARADRIVACWGAIAGDSGLVDKVLAAIRRRIPIGRGDVEIFSLGRTGAGAPIHVMARGRSRVPDTAQPILWRTL